MKLTIDSSVLVAAFVKSELRSDSAYALIQNIIENHHEVIIPITVLIESILAISRRANKKLALETQEFILSLPNIKLVEIDFDMALDVIGLGRKTGLKGMDAIVVHVANEFQAQLATLDREMSEKKISGVQVYSF